MNQDASPMEEWRYLDGSEGENGDGTSDPDLVFAHVSDLHGQLTPRHQIYYDNPKSKPDFDFGDDDRVIKRGGGVPILAAKLDELREDHEVCTLMSGDTFHGSAVTTFTDGQAMLDPINEHIGPDVYVPGNWDYSNEAAEDGNFVELMDGLDAPVLANNLYDWETKNRLYDPYEILDVGGLSVGVVGMTNVYVDRMAPAFYEKKYRFGKHLALLEESAKDARDDGADVVVAVTEIGLPWIVQAAKDCSNVDVIFSAHTHEYTHDPIVVEETETVVVESGMGEALGRVDLRIHDGDVQFRHHLYCLTEDNDRTPEPDSEAAETVEAARASFFEDDPAFERGAGTLDRPLDTVVGETETPLYRQSFLESAWNTLLNDALREHFGADLAVSHGFRYGTAIPPGEITLEQLYTFFPMATPVARGVASASKSPAIWKTSSWTTSRRIRTTRRMAASETTPRTSRLLSTQPPSAAADSWKCASMANQSTPKRRIRWRRSVAPAIRNATSAIVASRSRTFQSTRGRFQWTSSPSI